MLLKLRGEGKRLEKAKSQVDLMRGLAGFTRRYTFSKEMTVWMTQTLLAEKEFKKLEDQADFNNRVEPCHYIWKLIQGLLALLYSGLLMFVLLSILFYRAGVGTKILNPFSALNDYVLDLGQGDARLVIFWIVGTIFVMFYIFSQALAETGNEKLGFNFALLTYYSKAPGETQFNAFMASNWLDNVIAAAIIQQNIGNIFANYAKGSFIYWVSIEFRYSRLNPELFGTSFYTYILLFFFLITLISVAFIGANRIRYTDVQAAASSKKKGEKSKHKARDILTKNLVENSEEIIDM